MQTDNFHTVRFAYYFFRNCRFFFLPHWSRWPYPNDTFLIYRFPVAFEAYSYVSNNRVNTHMYFWKNSTQHALIRYYTHTGGRGAKRRGAKIFRQFKTKNEKNIFIKMVYLIKDNFWWKSSFDQKMFLIKRCLKSKDALDQKMILIKRWFWSKDYFNQKILVRIFHC